MRKIKEYRNKGRAVYLKENGVERKLDSREVKEFKEKRDNLIVQSYVKEEKSMYEIVSYLQTKGISVVVATVKNVLDERGVSIRDLNKLTEKQENRVVLEYEKGSTMLEIAGRYGVVENTIKKILDKNGVRRREMQEYTDRDLEHNYFGKIDSESKAYLLGYIIADGNVYKGDRSSMCVRLSIRDYDMGVLQLMKKELKTRCKIQKHTRNMVTLAVTSTKMGEDLSKYGVVPNKTFKTYLPEIPINYMRHLIRGLLDGDGCISMTWSPKGSQKKYISWCGNVKLIEQLRDYLVQELGVYEVKVTRRDNIAEVAWGSIRDIRLIGEFLYKDSQYYLDRKYRKYLEILECNEETKRKTN